MPLSTMLSLVGTLSLLWRSMSIDNFRIVHFRFSVQIRYINGNKISFYSKKFSYLRYRQLLSTYSMHFSSTCNFIISQVFICLIWILWHKFIAHLSSESYRSIVHFLKGLYFPSKSANFLSQQMWSKINSSMHENKKETNFRFLETIWSTSRI